MNKTKFIALGFLFAVASVAFPVQKASAAVQQTPITRTQAEQRALNMINLNWTYSKDKNGNLNSSYASYVTQPSQLSNITTSQMTGIPYNWGGQDGLDSYSYGANWTNFLDAVNKGAYIGNVNTDAGYGLIPGTAGIDCSGFVQATFNIQDSKLSTSTMFNIYFTKISLTDIKHMDILDRPGDHVVIFDSWGTLNGVQGAYTFESTPDQVFGGIQGTKKYFLAMDDLKNGYIAGRYVNIVDDSTSSTTPATTPTTTPVTTSTTPTATPTPTTTPAPVPATSYPHPVDTGVFVQVTNVNYAANFRSGASTDASVISTIPKNAILYTIAYSNGWYQVKYNGQVGWIWGNVISAVPSGKYVALNNVYQLNIRMTPSNSGTIVGILGQSQYAQVLGYSSDNQWIKISINGIQGYAYGKYLSYLN